MPNLNITVSDELLRVIRLKCAETGETQAELVARLVNSDGQVRGGDSPGPKRETEASSARPSGTSVKSATGPKKMSAEDYMKLSKSDKQTAISQGKF